MLAHYKFLGLIDTGAYDLPSLIPHAREISAALNLELVILQGTDRYLRHFLSGPWNDDYFVAALITSGIIASSGAFNPKADKNLTDRLEGDRYHLTDNVFLSQRDIRQVQLAKGAAITGILTLLSEAGRCVGDLEQIMVAGSFGYHLNPENLKCIGLLPAEYMGQTIFVGNSSLSGASLAVLNQDILRDMEHVASVIRVLDLGSHPDFSNKFISRLGFESVRESATRRLAEVGSVSR
ncbi:MAG: ASKHA domain-containing protein [Syntrophobacteraceae bacterium]